MRTYMQAKYSPSAALASKDCRAYTVLEPGQSVAVQHTSTSSLLTTSLYSSDIVVTY